MPEEQQANTRYFHQLASARFGFGWDKVVAAQAFHFKGWQGAKTGTIGHLPGAKVSAQIDAVRGLQPGEAAISPARFPDWTEPHQMREFAAEVRERTGGIPIGYKLSAQHIENDLDAALEAGVDYIILDGRGGATGAAPTIFRDHISVPTIPALARAWHHLDGPRRPRRHHADHHRRPAHAGRLHQGTRAGRRRRGPFQRRAAGHRMHRDAGLPYQHLPGGHRHPEAAPAGASDRGRVGASPCQLRMRRSCRTATRPLILRQRLPDDPARRCLLSRRGSRRMCPLPDVPTASRRFQTAIGAGAMHRRDPWCGLHPRCAAQVLPMTSPARASHRMPSQRTHRSCRS
jgi:hypothetical protein